MDVVHVIVARPLHPQPEWQEKPDWRPVAWAPSIEEAWAALDLRKEQERSTLTDQSGAHPHELEYDVWQVPNWESLR